MDFQVGDTVKIIDDSKYGMTCKNSEGIITRLTDSIAKIEFYSLFDGEGKLTEYPESPQVFGRIYLNTIQKVGPPINFTI